MEWQTTFREDRFGEINDYTGFANGELFESKEEIRKYFTRENMINCIDLPLSELPSQDDLDEMADMVIEYRWHMK